MITEERAQGSIEYLLMLTGAILVAVAVGLYLKSIPGSTQHAVNTGFEHVVNGF